MDFFRAGFGAPGVFLEGSNRDSLFTGDLEQGCDFRVTFSSQVEKVVPRSPRKNLGNYKIFDFDDCFFLFRSTPNQSAIHLYYKAISFKFNLSTLSVGKEVGNKWGTRCCQ